MPINVTDPIFSSNLVCLVHVYIITAMFKYNILYVAYPGYYRYITNYTCSFLPLAWWIAVINIYLLHTAIHNFTVF